MAQLHAIFSMCVLLLLTVWRYAALNPNLRAGPAVVWDKKKKNNENCEMVIVHEWWHYFHVYRTVASGIPSIDKRCKWIFFAKRIRILPIVFMPMTYRIVWFQFCLLFYGAKGLERMSKQKKNGWKKWNEIWLVLCCSVEINHRINETFSDY